MLSHRRDKEHILILQRHIGGSTIQDALQINREHFLGAVGLHAAEHGARDHGFFGHTLHII